MYLLISLFFEKIVCLSSFFSQFVYIYMPNSMFPKESNLIKRKANALPKDNYYFTVLQDGHDYPRASTSWFVWIFFREVQVKGIWEKNCKFCVSVLFNSLKHIIEFDWKKDVHKGLKIYTILFVLPFKYVFLLHLLNIFL